MAQPLWPLNVIHPRHLTWQKGFSKASALNLLPVMLPPLDCLELFRFPKLERPRDITRVREDFVHFRKHFKHLRQYSPIPKMPNPSVEFGMYQEQSCF